MGNASLGNALPRAHKKCTQGTKNASHRAKNLTKKTSNGTDLNIQREFRDFCLCWSEASLEVCQHGCLKPTHASKRIMAALLQLHLCSKSMAYISEHL